MAENGRKWPKMAENGRKWLKMAEKLKMAVKPEMVKKTEMAENICGVLVAPLASLLIKPIKFCPRCL